MPLRRQHTISHAIPGASSWAPSPVPYSSRVARRIQRPPNSSPCLARRYPTRPTRTPPNSRPRKCSRRRKTSTPPTRRWRPKTTKQRLRWPSKPRPTRSSLQSRHVPRRHNRRRPPRMKVRAYYMTKCNATPNNSQTAAIKELTMNTHLTLSTMLIASTLLAACSTVPQNARLDEARSQVQTAEGNAQVTNLAPVELKQAKEALATAEQAWTKREKSERVDRLAYLAQRRAMIAEETAKLKVAEQAIATANVDRDKVRLDARTLEEDKARQSAKATQSESAEAHRQLEGLQRQSHAMQDQAEQLSAEAKRQMADVQRKSLAVQEIAFHDQQKDQELPVTGAGVPRQCTGAIEQGIVVLSGRLAPIPPKPLSFIASPASPGAASRFYSQHPVATQLGDKPCTPQTFHHFIRHVATAGQLVRRARVVKQLALALQHPDQLIIENLRVEFAGDTEARRVVQNGINRIAQQQHNLLDDVTQRQTQYIVNLGRPRIQTSKPNHVGILLVRKHLLGQPSHTPRSKIAKPSAGI